MAANESGLPITMINKIKENLLKISNNLQEVVQTIDSKESNILNELEEIHHIFDELQVSTASYYLKFYLAPFTNQFEVLSASIQHLSERNHGALIVIQRKEPLDVYIHSGIPINADLSSPLLESIFYTGNPLHDGAVLICNDKIISAGNVLPLSDHKTGKKLGTRHRAALGLTERTDALVLVVSEETGGTTFSYRGNLYPIRTSGIHR